jgi:hypothetical protein
MHEVAHDSNAQSPPIVPGGAGCGGRPAPTSQFTKPQPDQRKRSQAQTTAGPLTSPLPLSGLLGLSRTWLTVMTIRYWNPRELHQAGEKLQVAC